MAAIVSSAFYLGGIVISVVSGGIADRWVLLLPNTF